MKEVLVIGGGIAGIQAALELAGQGLRVHLVEQPPSIGGRMAQLDKTFPANDCSICILSPKMVDCAWHAKLLLHTYSEVRSVRGQAGAFVVQVLKHPRYVDEDRCTGCGDCAHECRRQVPDPFTIGPSQRRAIYLHFPQAAPMILTIDPKNCTYVTKGKCGLCQMICQADAIDYVQQRQELESEVGAAVVATGYDFLVLEQGWNLFGQPGEKAQRMDARANPALCKGCGACAVACPTSANHASHFPSQRVTAVVQTALAD